MLKVIIAGGRDFQDLSTMIREFKRLYSNNLSEIRVISGGAKGADTQAIKQKL